MQIAAYRHPLHCNPACFPRYGGSSPSPRILLTPLGHGRPLAAPCSRLQQQDSSDEGEQQGFSTIKPLPSRKVSASADKGSPSLTQPDNNSVQSRALPRLLLLMVPLFWGTYGPTVRYIFEQPFPPAPSLLTFARKAVSLVFFFCFLPLEKLPDKTTQSNLQTMQHVAKQPKDTMASMLFEFIIGSVGAEWYAAMELGLWTFLGTACQTDGLEKTTATRSGFLLQSVTMFVPILSAFSGITVTCKTWSAAFLALVGLTCMSTQLQGNAASSYLEWTEIALSTGDVETLLAAFFYALCTVRLSALAANSQAIKLSTNLMVVSTCLTALWVLSDSASLYMEGNSIGAHNLDLQVLQTPGVLAAVIFSAAVPGTLASLFQTVGQRVVPATEAQVYYSLQPFWSAVLAAMFLGESINSWTWVAGAVLTLATLVAVSDDSTPSKE